MTDAGAEIIDLEQRMAFNSEDELLRHRILCASGTLPLGERGLIGLRFIFGIGYDEIARTVEIPEEEARRLAWKALKNLKDRVLPSYT
jgi:DNA-directed RNA polymerase specialized sigma24 family protein